MKEHSVIAFFGPDFVAVYSKGDLIIGLHLPYVYFKFNKARVCLFSFFENILYIIC